MLGVSFVMTSHFISRDEMGWVIKHEGENKIEMAQKNILISQKMAPYLVTHDTITRIYWCETRAYLLI